MDRVMRQRTRLVEAMRRIERLAACVDLPEGIAPIIAAMSDLRRLMRLHNAQKWRTLYAPAAALGDKYWAGIAAAFHREERELFGQYEMFVARWSDPAVVTHRSEAFQTEIAETLAAIADRGQREHALLFPIAEELRAAA